MKPTSTTSEIFIYLFQDLPKLLVSGDTIDFVKQSAALCLLKLFRTTPDVMPSSEHASRITHLLNDSHMVL